LDTHNINYSTLLNINNYKSIIYILFCFFFCTKKIHSQNQINKDSLLNVYKLNLYKKNDSLLYYFKEKKTKKWLNLLPSFSYNLTQKSVNVGFSLNSFANYYQQNQRNKIELAKLKVTLLDRSQTKIDQLNIEIETFFNEFQNLKNALKLYEIDKEIFEIKKGKYNNSEINTETFLNLKKSFLSKKNSLKNKFFRLQIKALKITQKTKSDLLQKSLFKLLTQFNNDD